MPSLVIKNLPKEIHDELKAAAKRNRRSVTQEALYSLERWYRTVPPIRVPEPVKTLKPISPERVVESVREAREAREARSRTGRGLGRGSRRASA
jgi:hypothetical protein